MRSPQFHDSTNVFILPGGSTSLSPGVCKGNEFGDLNLVDIQINQTSELQSYPSMAFADNGILVLDNALEKAPVAGLKQPRLQWNTLERFRRRLQFPNSCYVDPIGLSGGLALWWKEDINVEVKWKSKNMISENCKEVISTLWNHSQRGSAMFVVAEKLRNCKRALQPWGKAEFGNNAVKIKSLKLQLSKMQLDDFSQEQFDRERSTKAELEPNSSEGVVAVVLRDERGIVIDGCSKVIRAHSSLQGELLAIRESCLMVAALGLKGAMVESDNKEAIHLSVSELVPPWKFSALVWDIREIAQLGQIAFNWVRRSANKAAHSVASLALRDYFLKDRKLSSPRLQFIPQFISDQVGLQIIKL
ncbi:hypothetical protein Vadar_017036 [Vaccinium darrowii]|uniref:Uncharacterized protein n=1 Tax=Vaccinium darrowii TaxID=229202 RepID=A0ACB7YNH2_9ERIC|nr:hypothetical protein Vadar_017036 [Vaccinium darrowii]